MTDHNATDTPSLPPAVGAQVERGVRALDPERAAFDAWFASVQNPAADLIWEAWKAARPKRAAVGRLVNLAADCAQRKLLRSLEPLTEVTHIGHRQFARAYAGADEAVRLLAIELRRVADAL